MIVTVVGKRGKGKTTLTKSLIKQNKAKHVFILDYLFEYQDLSSKRVFVQTYDQKLSVFCRKVWFESGGSALAVFDEVDAYGKKIPSIEYLYRFGRHKGIDLIAVSRGFYDLPVMVRKLTDRFFLFQITDERDLTYLSRFLSRDKIYQLIHLKDFEYMELTF